MPVKKPAKKRSKTYTGCWTCRDRSVKCGEEKPTCLRCTQSGIQCEGYGVGLVWPGETGGRIRRRHMLEPSMANAPILNDSKLDLLLTQIDLSGPSDSLEVEYFCVFPISSASSTPDDDEDHSSTCGAWIDSSIVQDVYEVEEVSDKQHVSGPAQGSNNTVTIRRKHDPKADARWADLWNVTTNSIPQFLDPFFIRSPRERHLMHHWSSFLSGMMTPFPRPDNAFRDILTPLALTALNVNRDSDGHLALLHAIYTLTASSRSHITGPEERLNRANAHRHMVESVHHLSRSFNTTNMEEQQAILAAIVVLAIIPIFAGGRPVWRTHLRGGTLWLNSIDLNAWSQNRSALMIYQLFYFLTSFRPLQPPLAKGLGPVRYLLEEGCIGSSIGQSSIGDSKGWYLDTVLGIPGGVMTLIDRINNMLYADEKPSALELHELESDIYRSDPTNKPIKAPNELCERMARSHAMIFYYACQIYFATALLKASPQRVQHFVRQSIAYLGDVEHFERDYDVSGIMWPAFIAACEAEGPEWRAQALKYFLWREELGLANATDAKMVVVETWRRRDNGNGKEQVFWPDVMVDLDIDIVLS